MHTCADEYPCTKNLQCTHRLVKLECLVHLAGEAIDEEPAAPGAPPRGGGGDVAGSDGGAHGGVEELDGDLHRDDRALADACADELAVGGALARLLRAQQVAGGEVAEVERFDEAGALGALAGTGAAEDEDDGDLGWVHVRAGGEICGAGGRGGGLLGGAVGTRDWSARDA